MANYIEIDTGILQGDIGTMATEVHELRQRIQNLQAEVTELSSMWSGRANAVFQQQFALDMEFMNDFADVLEQLISCMEYAKKEYDRCENEVEDLVASIHI